MHSNDSTPGSRLALALGTTAVLAYSIATADQVLSGDSAAAFGWGWRLVLGLGLTIVIAVFIERRAMGH